MAKRKNRFRYHGKCVGCGGPITDWRESLAAGYVSMSRREYKSRVFRAMYDDVDALPDNAAWLANNFCPGACRLVADAEYRLEDDYSRIQRVYADLSRTAKEEGVCHVLSGRMSASQPNIAQTPRAGKFRAATQALLKA